MKYSVTELNNKGEIRKLPDGFNIRVVRKEDILDTIDKNILDKDVALEVISHCEISAINFFKNGYWASIPHMGNFRLDPRKVLRKETLDSMDGAAKQFVMSDDPQSKARYILFRKQVSNDAREEIEFKRYYNYSIALEANRNRKIFNKMCKKIGMPMTRLRMWGLMTITPLDNRFEYIYSHELAAQDD